MQLIRIGYNYDTGRKFGNLIVVLNQGLKKIQLGFSSKIEVPRLGSEPSQLGLARAGKFQLELISKLNTIYSVNNFSYIDFHINFDGMLSVQFSEVRQFFLKAVFQWRSFDVESERVRELIHMSYIPIYRLFVYILATVECTLEIFQNLNYSISLNIVSP